MTEKFKPLDKKKEFTPNKYILPFYYEEDLKEHIRLLMQYNKNKLMGKDFIVISFKDLIKILGKGLTE